MISLKDPPDLLLIRVPSNSQFSDSTLKFLITCKCHPPALNRWYVPALCHQGTMNDSITLELHSVILET